MHLDVASGGGVIIQGGGNHGSPCRGHTGTRLVTYSKNNCPQCDEWLLAPDWSEYLNERCVRHTWSCEACGYQFETAVFFAGSGMISRRVAADRRAAGH